MTEQNTISTEESAIDTVARELAVSRTDARTLLGLWQGMSNIELADTLGVREGTVKSRLSRLYRQIGVTRRPAAALRVQEILGGTSSAVTPASRPVETVACTETANEGQYLDLVRRVLLDGERREDRTGTGTLSIFGAQCRYDLRRGFPVLTTKKVNFSSVVYELLWFLSGETNIHAGLSQHTKIWDAWADDDGDLGPVYGAQWRHWGGRQSYGPRSETDMGRSIWYEGGVDQIADVVRTIKEQPHSRRLLVSAWNVTDLPEMALPPCHFAFQFYVGFETVPRAGAMAAADSSERWEQRPCWLDVQVYQRSADLALGVPFNVASYALLLSMVARECGLKPRYLVHTLGDAHVYLNHVAGLEEQLSRAPLPPPELEIDAEHLDDHVAEGIRLIGYKYHPAIKFDVAV